MLWPRGGNRPVSVDRGVTAASSASAGLEASASARSAGRSHCHHTQYRLAAGLCYTLHTEGTYTSGSRNPC
jgi:hypothetical protein